MNSPFWLVHFPDFTIPTLALSGLGGAAAVVRFREVVARPGRAIGGNRFLGVTFAFEVG